MTSVYEFTVLNVQGQAISLSAFRGKVMLIANTASRCVYTPQYTGLQSLYDSYRDRGLEVLGFPCDQFGHQEPGDNDEIQAFCSTQFAVTFPVLQKIEVNGPNAAPLYQHLKAAAPGVLGTQRIKWNFTKFLVGPDGQSVWRYAPNTPPQRLASRIERLLS